MIGGGGDTTIPSPGWLSKQPLPGIRLHDPLHDRQACLELTHFTRRLVKYVPGRSYFGDIPSQSGDKFATSPTRAIHTTDWTFFSCFFNGLVYVCMYGHRT